MKTNKHKISNLQFSSDKLKFEDTEDSRVFSGTAYSGLPIMNHEYWGNLIFDTSNISSEEFIPVLFNHDPNRIVGFGSIRPDGAIFIDGKISKVTEEGRMVSGLIDEGFPMKESVYIEPDLIERFEEGQKFSVNGQDLVGPFTVFKNSKIKEVSMTPLPADINTSTQIFNDRLNDTITLKELEMSTEAKTEAVTEISANEVKFQELVNSGKITEAFEFACSCENKVKDQERTGMSAAEGDLDGDGSLSGDEAAELTPEEQIAELTSLLEAATARIVELEAEIAEMQGEAQASAAMSEITKAESVLGLKFSDEAKKSMSKLDKEALNSILKGVKPQVKKNNLSSKLFTDAKQESGSVEFDRSSSKSILDAAMKFKESQKAKGVMIKEGKAVTEFLKSLNK